jgi:hypothetical protein
VPAESFADVLRPTRQHRHAAIIGELLEALLPGQHVLDGDEIVGVLLGLAAYVDHRKRHHELARNYLLDGDAVF